MEHNIFLLYIVTGNFYDRGNEHAYEVDTRLQVRNF
jgi:hypothetical protein